MILGTVLEGKATRTIFGMEYRVQYDANPEAKCMSGLAGTALRRGIDKLKQGDRVVLEYQVGPARSYGLWFIVRKV